MNKSSLKPEKRNRGGQGTPLQPQKITIDNSGNYPIVNGAGKLGEIVNEQWSDIWVKSNWPQFPSFNEMAIDILVADYNERHSAAASPPEDKL